jgi:hypothetical protein
VTSVGLEFKQTAAWLEPERCVQKRWMRVVSLMVERWFREGRTMWTSKIMIDGDWATVSSWSLLFDSREIWSTITAE